MTGYRYICWGCEARFGLPDPKGWIDIKSCDKCATRKNVDAEQKHAALRPPGWLDNRLRKNRRARHAPQ